MRKKIIAREIVGDIRAGMPHPELRQKYGLSSEDLQKVLRQIAKEREARAHSIATDVKSGMSDAALIKKYQVSAEGLEKILKDLLRDRFLSLSDLDRSGDSRANDTVIVNVRKAPRNRPVLSINVHEEECSVGACALRDITEQGLAVTGIRTVPQKTSKLMILGDEFGEVVPFELEAECRWVGTDGPDEVPVAGFRITRISEADRGRLRDFVRAYTAPIDR